MDFWAFYKVFVLDWTAKDELAIFLWQETPKEVEMLPATPVFLCSSLERVLWLSGQRMRCTTLSHGAQVDDACLNL